MELAFGVLQGFNEADDTFGFPFIKSHITMPPSAAAPWDRLKHHPLCRHRRR